MRGMLQSGQVWLRQGTPRVFGYSFLQFGQMHASGGIPLRCIPIPGPPFGIEITTGSYDGPGKKNWERGKRQLSVCSLSVLREVKPHVLLCL